MSLIPQMSWGRIQGKTGQELAALPCVEIVDEQGKYIGTLMVPMTDYVKTQCEYMGMNSNAIHPTKGQLAEDPVETERIHCEQCGFEAESKWLLGQHRKKHRKVASAV